MTESVFYANPNGIDCDIQLTLWIIAWMEQVKSPIAIDAATRAAQQTTRSELEKETGEKEVKVSSLSAILRWPAVFVNDVVKPLGRAARKKAKEHVELILFGKSPYSCQVRATGVNFLVCCSATFLFLESLALAFSPASSDYAVAAVGAYVSPCFPFAIAMVANTHLLCPELFG